MLTSMTGYGQGQVANQAASVSVEIRTVNHRFLDFSIKLPKGLSHREQDIKEAVRGKFTRGRVALLEFALPTNPALAGLYQLYFRRVLPWIGRHVSARGSAYRYLPRSVLQFPQRRDLVDAMLAAGFERPAWRDLTGGIVCLYTGSKR